jgi:hypothetical protein
MNRFAPQYKVVVLLAIVCCCCVGCARSKPGQLPTAQVTGQVTYRGKPLDHGVIQFLPMQAAGEGVRVANGIIDEQGYYHLGTYGEKDGALLGDFQVVVECRVEAPRGPMKQPGKAVIPERYAAPASSGLTAHVAAGDNTANFELKD